MNLKLSRPRLDRYERKIMAYLNTIQIPQTTSRIAQRTHISWATTKDKLISLREKDLVCRGQFKTNSKLIYWVLND